MQKGVLSLGEQVDLFNKTVEEYLPLHLKKARISKHISKSIFLVVVGVNDIGLNLLKKVNSTHSYLYKSELDGLVEKLGNHLTVNEFASCDYKNNNSNNKIKTIKVFFFFFFFFFFFQDLYDLGARKFVVFEVEALGCLPFYVNKFKPTNSKCVKYLNNIAAMLNRRLRLKLKNLYSGLKGSTFVTGKYFDYTLNLVINPNNSGEQLFPLCKALDELS